MDFLKNINFGLSARLPVILQTESAECGLACLAMIAHYHGYLTDLWSLRQKYPISQKGATLHTLIKIAGQMKLSTRPLRLKLNELNQLRTPCILHWDMNHFVVLKSVSKTKITILDPSAGQRLMTLQEASDHFTGIALEVWADSDFEKKEDKANIRLSKLIGEIKGLYKPLGQILILALVLEVFALTSPFFMQWVIDHAIVSADKDLLTTLVIGFGILMLLTQLTSLLQSWISMYISTTLNIQWKANVFHHLTHLPSQFFQKRHLGDIISRFGAIDSIQSTLTTTFLTVVLDSVMTVFTLVLMFFYSPTLAWIAVGAMIIYGLLRFLWYTPLKQATEEQIIHAAKQSTHFMETMRGIRAIKRFNKEDIRKSTWLTLFVNTINAGIAYKNQFGGRVSNLIDKFIEVKMLNLHGERLADIVLEKTEKNDYLSPIEPKDKLVYDIQVNNLSFAYNDDEPYIIDNLSFHIKDKESVAIVGATGCGKSTLMSLLMGELTPKSGDIKIAGKIHHSMAELNARGIIASVNQDDTLFAGSLIENISFFDDKIDNEWVEQCAIMAGIHDEIMAMPMGYQTLVGDMGNVLSGGQKQRIFIARALYRRPKILFLDEATSHLDVKKEYQINEMIKSLGITRVMIAHRPETIKSADWVLNLG